MKPVLLCTLVLSGFQPAAVGSFFYSKEVHPSLSFSNGYLEGDSLYFLLSYTLLRKPKGIARFPDGGIAHRLFDKTFLYRYNLISADLARLTTLTEQNQPGSNLKYALFDRKGDLLRVMTISGHGENFRTSGGLQFDLTAWTSVAWDLEKDIRIDLDPAEKSTLLEIVQRTWVPTSDWTFSQVRRAIENLPPHRWHLPSPLEYCKKSENEYAADLVALRGNQLYRNAIIDSMATGQLGIDPETVLRKIASRKKELEGVKQQMYELFVKDTETALNLLREKQP